MQPLYQYRPLRADEIRLVELLPGAYGGEIRIEIHHELLLPRTQSTQRLSKRQLKDTLPEGWRVYETPEGRYLFAQLPDLQHACFQHPDPKISPDLYEQSHLAAQPDFESLSYVWGLPGGENAVLVEAAAGDQILPVWVNLALALRNLRLPDRRRRLWIDAICINQDDFVERAAQVQRMGLIYGQATRVVVWLGPSSNDSGLAFATLQDIGENIEISDSRRLFDAPNAPEEWWTTRGLTNSQYNAIVSILSRPWFRRVWVIQEIALANANALFRCGDDQIPYYYLRRAVAFLSPTVGDELTTLLRGMESICWGLANSGPLKLLLTSRSQQCSDPRDRVYGMLSLMGPRIAQNLQPSYTRSCIDVYQDLFMAYCEQTKRLDLLTSCGAGTAASNTPTWIPDWRREPDRRFFLVPGFQASGLSKAEFAQGRTGELLVKGIRCGTVTTALPPISGDAVLERLKETKPDESLCASYPDGSTAFDAWLRVLSLDYSEDRLPSATAPSRASWESYILDIMNGVEPDYSLDAPYARDTYYEMKNTLQQATYLCLDSGHFGVTVGEAQEGDCVYVILGCWLPLLLRPVSKNRFMVMGMCFLPGLMDAEAILGTLPPNWQVQQKTKSGHRVPNFFNANTGETQRDDPRLGDLPMEWARANIGRSRDDPIFVDYFQHKVTGELQNWDPRLSLDALERRGVLLTTVELI